jgi:transposase
MSLATAESLRTPSSPICKPWKCVCIGEATRATVSGCRGVILRRVEVIGTDLARRATNNLLGRQHACPDEAAYDDVPRGGVAHRGPRAFRRAELVSRSALQVG